MALSAKLIGVKKSGNSVEEIQYAARLRRRRLVDLKREQMRNAERSAQRERWAQGPGRRAWGDTECLARTWHTHVHIRLEFARPIASEARSAVPDAVRSWVRDPEPQVRGFFAGQRARVA